jgi:hypothetical protein
MPGFPKRFLRTHTANIVRNQKFNDVRKRNHTAEALNLVLFLYGCF